MRNNQLWLSVIENMYGFLFFQTNGQSLGNTQKYSRNTEETLVSLRDFMWFIWIFQIIILFHLITTDLGVILEFQPPYGGLLRRANALRAQKWLCRTDERTNGRTTGLRELDGLKVTGVNIGGTICLVWHLTKCYLLVILARYMENMCSYVW